MKTEDAVEYGIKQTAGVVTSAAFVMVGVFAIFGTLSIIDFKMLGIGLAVAIFIDATLVRAVLLPATMKLLGDRNWYLPSKLGWLPSLEHEGSTEPRTRTTARCRSRPPHNHPSSLDHLPYGPPSRRAVVWEDPAVDPEELASALIQLTEWAHKHAPQPEPPVRAREHFGGSRPSSHRAARSSADRPNFQVAIDEWADDLDVPAGGPLVDRHLEVRPIPRLERAGDDRELGRLPPEVLAQAPAHRRLGLGRMLLRADSVSCISALASSSGSTAGSSHAQRPAVRRAAEVGDRTRPAGETVMRRPAPAPGRSPACAARCCPRGRGAAASS